MNGGVVYRSLLEKTHHELLEGTAVNPRMKHKAGDGGSWEGHLHQGGGGPGGTNKSNRSGYRMGRGIHRGGGRGALASGCEICGGDHRANNCPFIKGKEDSELSQEDLDKKNRGKQKDKMDKQQAHYDKMNNAGTGGRRRGNAQQGQFNKPTRANCNPYLLNNPYLLDFI